jgi:hypothetical protein
VDNRRHPQAQGVFESSSAANGDREEDETNRGGPSAKGGNSWHRLGTSPRSPATRRLRQGRLSGRPFALSDGTMRHRWRAVSCPSPHLARCCPVRVRSCGAFFFAFRRLAALSLGDSPHSRGPQSRSASSPRSTLRAPPRRRSQVSSCLRTRRCRQSHFDP